MAKRVRYQLLSDELDNGKLAKTAGTHYRVAGLSLAPADISGHEMCPARGECVDYCVGKTAGRVVIWDSVMKARIRRTKLFVNDRPTFRKLLWDDVRKLRDTAMEENREYGCRLNTFSDQAWETIEPELFVEFSDGYFWDYTKIRGRMNKFLEGNFPKNYHLCFSLSERTPRGYAGRVLELGGTVAAAIDISIRSSDELPSRFVVDGVAYPTIDGDISDLRFTDVPGHVVLLRAKGNLLSRDNKFVRSADGN